MKSIGQLFVGLITAIASSLIVLSATLLSTIEGQLPIAPVLPTNTRQAIVQEFNPIETVEVNTPTLPPPPTATPSCAYPKGWVAYIILSGDTLESLAEKSGTTVEDLYTGNCLEGKSLVISAKLYLPPPPTVTVTPTKTNQPTEAQAASPTFTITPTALSQCPPASWVRYVVKAGDNLYRIGLAYGVTVDLLMSANCLSSENIRTGQILYVPNVKPRFPTSTATPTEAPPPPKPTQEPSPIPTVAPTIEPTVAPTAEPTAEPTVEPTIDPTIEPTMAPTAEPSAEPTAKISVEPTKAVSTETSPGSYPLPG